MFVIRARFSKTGEAAYISHLDLQRVMARAVRMSAVPVNYSSGFNPHIYMTFALPLPLSYQSICEAVDFKSEQPSQSGWTEAINKSLPSGIRLFNISLSEQKTADIGFCNYNLSCKEKVFEKLLCHYNNADVVDVIKTTKRSEHKIDLKQYIEKIEYTVKDGIICADIRFPTGDVTLSPAQLLTYFDGFDQMSSGAVSVTRLSILNKDGNEWN